MEQFIFSGSPVYLRRCFLGLTGYDLYNVSEFYTMGFVCSDATWPLLDTTAWYL